MILTVEPTGNVVAVALALSLDKPLEWAVGFFFGNTELSLELWTVIAGVSVLMTNPSGTNGTAGIIGSIISNRSHLCYSSM